tara:strand:+ start:193 stop:822 length:630 start_codon:yes stop_codon:yes gene_type:complete
MYFKIKRLSKKYLDFLYNLRNDPLSIKYSLNKKKILYKEHKNWYKRLINSQNTKCFIFVNKKNNPIGYVRFLIKNFQAEVSIAVIDEYRGKGISSDILYLAEKKLKVKKFKAKVNILNFKSISLFKSLGYTITKKDKNFIIMNKETPSKSKKYLDIINKIERVRKKNNSNWMDILRIAFKHAPSETSKIMRNIYKEDKNISSLAKKLTR